MIEPTFDPKSVESRLYAAWERLGAFQPKRDPKAETYCVVIPPPNVTGALHIGHALNNTLQDVLIRFERLRGKAVLWQPGLDHAGIATQMVVERQMAAAGNADRRALGREEFVKRVWTWKAESGGAILQQLRRLGCSADWSRERFTLDEGLSRAVAKVFVELHRQKLIYRDKRLVNWHPGLQTAVSDLEVENVETKGFLWHIRYPLAGDPARFIVVATTRPETMLGDSAVAVNPTDERYTEFVGKALRLPLADRDIPVVADEYSDPEKGSGAVKITPAHDFNDFEVGKRHNLPALNILTPEGRLNDSVPAAYRGLDVAAARKKVVADLEELGLIEKIEPIVHSVPFDEKSKSVVIEPYLTDQWYVDAAKLAGPAIAAVEKGETTFAPKNWEKTYFEWMRNIQPWCVSRQLWWGHRIPAWYGPDGEIFVAHHEAEAVALATDHYGKLVKLERDEDVLDTWFSSALWPFSTLGWPDETRELKRFYPTNTLVTAHDIIFFWVARMMMMGIHFLGAAPFKDVYIHALVRDEKGAKMSKTKGNVMDPLLLIDKYGADALRFTLAAMAAQGRDIKLSESRIEGYRNFATKLWNAARFCQMNECALWDKFDPTKAEQKVNRWIIGEMARVAAAVTRELEAFRFNEAANALYRFVWNVFCDWYLELIKPLLNGEDEDPKAETRRTAAWVLDQILVLLHPFMPFITEELWDKLAEFGAKREAMLIAQTWPKIPMTVIDPSADEEIDWVIRLVSETRAARAELNVPPGAKIPLLVIGAAKPIERRLELYQDLIDRLARLEYSTSAAAPPPGSVTFVLDGAVVALPLKGVVDFNVEAERLAKEIKRLEGEAAKLAAKLANAEFVAKAPEEVVEEQRERRADAEAAAAKFRAALDRLRAAA